MSRPFGELRGEYENFLRSDMMNGRIATTLDDGASRLNIRFSELRSAGTPLSEEFRTDPLNHLRALEKAAQGIAMEERPEYLKTLAPLKVGIEGPIQATASNPRQLIASSLRQLVCVEGVATRVSDIQPKVVKSVHYCPATGKSKSKEYVDATDPSLGLPQLSETSEELQDKYIQLTNAVYPTRDDQENELETEYGLSDFKDYQTIRLQEMPETAPMGQLPRSVELVLDSDMVERIKPGDRVMVTGVYRALATHGRTAAWFDTAVLVNHVRVLGRSLERLQFDPKDIAKFRELSQREDILRVIGASVAPSIHGHERIKQAIALQLLSGMEKNLENGTHLRGDINILMVGDPSTAKSQLLRAAMTIAPLAVSTTGKGSSGVGLTAAVTSDPDTRERRLEAGAMVLADRGLVCVDEFDKMSEADRVAIHEAMEQQTVTIAKAGMHASLNARCAVLAAANPVYGQYDKQSRVTENIGLPDSLLSRFDLLFVVLDTMDPETDRRIASHVLQSHRTRTQEDDEEEDKEQQQRMWDKPDSILSLSFLRKYLHYAKTCRKPKLNDDVREAIVARYAEMRAAPSEIAVTARSLETIIRLSTAHAKARLSTTVDVRDVGIALDILRFALFHEDTAVPVTDDDDDGDVDNSTDGVESPFKRRRLNESSLQKRIWDILSETDDILSIEELAKLTGSDDSDDMKDALRILQEKQQIVIDDGVVCKI